jgi:aspartyl-tRNA(Asn)/glutamyl-tRNA(Gln) amidotransferase subunit C
LKITEKEVRYVADLANLRLTDDEVNRMVHDLDEILEHVGKMNELDTTAVEPMAQVIFESSASTLRADIEQESLGNEAALKNAPQPGSGFFKVPKVIER